MQSASVYQISSGVCRAPMCAEFCCAELWCAESGNRNTTKQDLSQNLKLQQNNSLDPPVHGDTSQYHSLTKEEGGLEENSGRSSLRGHAQLGQVMLRLLKIMPSHIYVQGKKQDKNNVRKLIEQMLLFLYFKNILKQNIFKNFAQHVIH